MDWTVHDAGQRLGELMALATTEGPQKINGVGGAAVVVVAESAYRVMAGEQPTLKDLILNGPSLEGVILNRDESPARDAGL
jgi:hypothetical protein